jgi:hypothetical protein
MEQEKVWKGLHPNVKRGVMALKENVIFKEGRAYSLDGKDVSHLVELAIKTTDKQISGLNVVGELGQHESDLNGFVFAFFESLTTMEERFPTLTQSDLARLMYLGTFAGWNDGLLKHDNGVLITKKGLAELIGVSRNKFKEFYEKLIDGGMIAEDEGSLYMNPKYFFRGEMSQVREIAKTYQYTRLFRKTVRDLYVLYNGRTIKQLAIIYSVLPFVNFNFNQLCYNPEESNPDLVRHITVDKLTKAMRALKHDGKSVFGFFEADDRRQKKVVINPRVVYAGDGKRLEAIRSLFN